MQNETQENVWEIVLMLDKPLLLTQTPTRKQFDLLQDDWLNVDCTERVFRVPKPDICTNMLTDKDCNRLKQAFAWISTNSPFITNTLPYGVPMPIECWKIIEYCLDFLLASKDVYRKYCHLLENQSSCLETYLLYLKVCKKFNWIPIGMPESTTIEQLLDAQRWGPINSALLVQQWNELNQKCEAQYLNPCTDDKHYKESIERLRQMNPILFHPKMKDAFERFGAIIAGGSILSALDPSIPTLPTSDIDIFHNYHYYLGFTPAVLSVLEKEFDEYAHQVIHTDHVTNIYFTPKNKESQPIKPLQIVYSSAVHSKEMVSSFHMDYVRTYFDPTTELFFAAPEAIISWDSKVISVLNHPCNTKSMAKALYKGFTFSSAINTKHAFPATTWSHLTTKILEHSALPTQESESDEDGSLVHGHAMAAAADIEAEVEQDRMYANLQTRKASCNIHNARWTIGEPITNNPRYNSFPLHAETAHGLVGLPVAETPLCDIQIDDHLAVEQGQVALVYLTPEDHENEDWRLLAQLNEKFDERMKNKVVATYRSHPRPRISVPVKIENRMIASTVDDVTYLKFVLVENSAVYLDGILVKIGDIVPRGSHQTFKGFCAFQITHLYTAYGLAMVRQEALDVTTRKEVVDLHLFTKQQ
uniref:Uncharacterized protein n=1 Tax=Clandestinovirus TaxID=2831644 RepID=A0A8F8KRI5_9VIRU|nr:hypothetical protein KOM_12_561 [Clandestinovirus]